LQIRINGASLEVKKLLEADEFILDCEGAIELSTQNQPLYYFKLR
jgi:hypothetical protein